MGATLVTFQSQGSFPSVRERLKSLDIAGAILTAVDLNILDVIESCPHDLKGSMFDNKAHTLSSVHRRSSRLSIVLMVGGKGLKAKECSEVVRGGMD